MRPTFDEIRRAAYERWERRGSNPRRRSRRLARGREGADLPRATTGRSSITSSTAPDIGSSRAARSADADSASGRPDEADFGEPRPVVAGPRSLLSAEVCDDCQRDWRESAGGRVPPVLGGPRSRRDAGIRRPRPSGPSAVLGRRVQVAGRAALLIDARGRATLLHRRPRVGEQPRSRCRRPAPRGAECWVYRAPFLGDGRRGPISPGGSRTRHRSRT